MVDLMCPEECPEDTFFLSTIIANDCDLQELGTMSSGPFERVFYETSSENGGFTLSARVQPETLAASVDSVPNVSAAGPADAPGSATISQGRRTAGVNMRYVTLGWTASPPAGYSGDPVRIPVLTPATFTAWTLGSTGTYLGAAVEVLSRVGETVK